MKTKKRPAPKRKPPTYWKPNELALSWGCPDTPVTVKRFIKSPHNPWVLCYAGRKQVWDCNAAFFKKHFTKAQVR